jgi:hypothetical protein
VRRRDGMRDEMSLRGHCKVRKYYNICDDALTAF